MKLLSEIFLLLLLLMLSSGCSAIPGYGTGQTKTTKITVDPETKIETTVIEEPVQESSGGFFKSENLAAYYDFEKSRNTSHKESVKHKTSAIVANTEKIMQLTNVSDTEKLLSGIISNMMIDRIETSQGPSGIQAPKAFADVMDRNFTGLVNLGLGIWDRIDSSNSNDGDSAIVLNNTGDGNIFYQSDSNTLSQQTSKYTLGDSAGDLSFLGNTFTPAISTSDSNDTTTTSTRTDSANSETSTLW